MIEIALCLAIIGFALVAILGVLPSGARMQEDTRGEAIIDQDAKYILDAIRAGPICPTETMLVSRIDQLGTSDRIYLVSMTSSGTKVNQIQLPVGGRTDSNLVNMLTVFGTDRRNGITNRLELLMRSLSGPATMEAGVASDLAFRYKLTAWVEPYFHTDVVTLDPGPLVSLYTNLYLLRLAYEWPVSTDNDPSGINLVGRQATGSPKSYNQLFSAHWTNASTITNINTVFFTP